MKKSIIKSLIIATSILNLNINLALANSQSYDDKDPQIIHLIAENHLDPQSIKYKKHLEAKALNKEIILAEEGGFFNTENEYIFGIEDKNTYILTFAWDLYHGFALYKIAERIENEVLADGTKRGAVIQLSPSRALRNMLMCLNLNTIYDKIYQDNKQIMVKIGKLYLLRKNQPLDYQNTIDLLANNHSANTPFFLTIDDNLSAWFNLFKDIVNTCYNDAANENQISPHVTNQITSLMTNVEHCLKLNPTTQRNKILTASMDIMTQFNDLDQEITLNQRNHIFLRNIISIFENNQSQEKPFYVIIGLDHSPFLYEQLKQKGYQVELNEIGQITYNNYLEKSSEKADL